jgi:hypothetical protein
MKKFSKTEAKEIGNGLKINWDKISLDAFTKGLNVELEHGAIHAVTNVTNNDGKLTGEIALAHLNEFPDYYTRLAKLEKEAREYWKKH